MSINRSKMKRQMYQAGGLGAVPRRQFGFGDFVGDIVETVTKPVKKVAQKIVPKEIAGPLMMAAPFLGPVYGPLAYAAGSAKRTGRIDPLKLALIAAPYVQFQGGEGLGAFKPVGYGGSKYGVFGGETIGIGDMEGVSAAEKASELFEKDFEFLGKDDKSASIKDVLGDVATSPEFIVGGGLSLVQYIEAKKQEKEDEGLEFSQEDYDNAVNDYYKQYSESFKKGFKTGGVVSKRKKFKGGMSDNRVTQLLTLREEAMENGDDDKVQEIDQELGLIFKQYKTGGRVGLKDGLGLFAEDYYDEREFEIMEIAQSYMREGMGESEAYEQAVKDLGYKTGGRVGLKDGANDEAIYMTEDGKEVDTGEGQFLTMEEAKERDPAMFMDTTTYNPIPADAPEQAANEIARIMLGISDLPREEGEVESDTMSSTEFMYNEYLIPKRKELMENFGLSMPEADDLIRKKMMEIRSQNADGGSIKGIGQLAKPKGNKRQGFRGEAAAASDKAAGRNAGRSDTGSKSGRGDGPKTGAPSREMLDELARQRKEKEPDVFEQAYKGPTKFGSGYKTLNVPGQTKYGFQNPVAKAVLTGLGYVSGIPGLGFLANAKNLGPFDNEAFYDTKVTQAGKLDKDKYPDFDSYMEGRMKGEIDAYGNPKSTRGGNDNKYIPPVSEGIKQVEVAEKTPAVEDDLYAKYSKSLQRGFAKDGGLKKVPVRTSKIGVKELDYRQDGGFVPLGVKERADDVPAMLSKNEFVFTADAVRGAGNGNINKGARKMYDLMNKLEARKV